MGVVDTRVVTVKPGAHHRTDHHGGDVIEVTEAEFSSFGDKFIYPAIDATKEAWSLGLSIDQMRTIHGSGKDGRILKSDVEAFLGRSE
jgi:hypothetical protein